MSLHNFWSTWPFPPASSLAYLLKWKSSDLVFKLFSWICIFIGWHWGSWYIVVIWYPRHSAHGGLGSHIHVCTCNSHSGSALLPCCNQLINQSFKPINQFIVQKKVAQISVTLLQLLIISIWQKMSASISYFLSFLNKGSNFSEGISVTDSFRQWYKNIGFSKRLIKHLAHLP